MKKDSIQTRKRKPKMKSTDATAIAGTVASCTGNGEVVLEGYVIGYTDFYTTRLSTTVERFVIVELDPNVTTIPGRRFCY